jgi:hypothetical protein
MSDNMIEGKERAIHEESPLTVPQPLPVQIKPAPAQDAVAVS